MVPGLVGASWPLAGGAGALHGEDAHGGEEGDGGGGGCHAQSEGGNAGLEGRPHGPPTLPTREQL